MAADKTGLVTRRMSGFYYVYDGDRTLECRLRGKAKKGVILTGDMVRVSDLGDGTGIIEGILPRRSELVRPPVANVDMVIIVIANARPEPSLWLLDRLLILVEHQGLIPVIAINKSDLPPRPEASFVSTYYAAIGYPVVATSALTGQGLADLRDLLKERIAVLAGPSGVGKSSLLNAMLPGLTLQTGDVSRKIERGRHTTRHTELIALPDSGWVADSPGFSVLDLPPDVDRRRLPSLFREFARWAQDCRFADCQHAGERECGVKDAVNEGKIARSRYENYLALLDEVKERERSY